MVDDARAARWGIQHRYGDAAGLAHEASDEAIDQVIAAMRREDDGDGPAAGDEIAFLPLGRTDLPPHLLGRRLVTEDGADLGHAAEVPPDLPAGYHHLVDDDGDGRATVLVVHPAAGPAPATRMWGWGLQMHSDRSAESWGIGDLADARTIARWSAAQGGDAVVLLNPLHAPNLGSDPEPSPYFASTRCFRNPLALRIEDIAGPGPATDAVADLAQAARRLNGDRHIDRASVWALKRAALERLWAADELWPAHDAARRAVDGDRVLAAFAAFMVAIEEHGEPWSAWPPDLRHPDGTGWPPFRQRHRDRILFHAWLQAAVADQLTAVATEATVLGDLAVGTDRAGFDAWYWQDLFVLDGTRIGAPADQFNTLGQDWGLPPIDPWRLRAACYEPFIRMLRCGFGAGHGLRIDHVMGLFRLFWIPPGLGAADGLYVRQPAEELLALIALESTRAGAWVIGEDLGTVEAGVRETLAAHNVLSYRVMSLDDTPPEHYPERSVAAVSTHDLATIAGFWSGSDLADQERLGMEPPVDETWAARHRFGHRVGVAEDASVAEVVVAAHRTLATAPSRILLAQLEDAALVPERPNMPGTTDQWPNWSLALPEPIEVVLASDLAAEVAGQLRRPRSGDPG